MAPGNDNGWQEWKNYVLAELKRLAKCNEDSIEVQRASTEVQRAILVEIAGLKVKSTIWGVIGGSIPVLVTILIALMIWLIRG